MTNIFETPDPQQCEAKEVRVAKFFSILKPAFSDINTLKKHMKYAKKKFELDVTEDEIELEKIARDGIENFQIVYEQYKKYL